MRARIYITALALLAGSFAFSACNSSAKPKASTEKPSGKKEVYSCEMNPEVISEKPGKCPKCGMELTKKMVPDTTKVTQ
jgi:Cu(I)/Ag(I) efflux system membrane fusion protein